MPQPTPATTKATAAAHHSPSIRIYPATSSSTGTATVSSIRRTTPSAVSPCKRASGASTSRWANTAGANSFTSSGSAKPRPLEQGPSLGRPVQGQSRPGARPQEQPLVLSGRPHHFQQIGANHVADEDPSSLLLQPQDVSFANDRSQAREGVVTLEAAEHGVLFLADSGIPAGPAAGTGRVAPRATGRFLPALSGFWVARTKNGSGKARVTPSTVTCRSSMASRSADWARGVARLISSASKIWVKIGPGRKSNSAVC